MKNFKEAIESSIDSQTFLIRCNMRQTLRLILWDRYLATGDEQILQDADRLVDIVLDDSTYEGPDGETYPSFSRERRHELDALIEKLKKVIINKIKKVKTKEKKCNIATTKK